MNKKTLAPALACALAAAMPVHADEVSDLKAEIAAQKAQAAAQQARLDQLEQKLNTIQAAGVPSATKSSNTPVALATDQQGGKLEADPGSVTLYSNGDTSLKLYGLLEATASHANHQTAAGGSATGYQTAWFSGNRLGFDAEHALTSLGQQWSMPDLKVISKLEAEFELPTGNMDTSDVFFNRDAWLGVYSDSLGKITLGRQNTLTRDFTANWGDPYGGSEVSLKEGGYSNVNNFKQFIFYSGGANGTRLNSAIEWKKKFGDHIVAGVGYAFGSGGAGGSGDVGNGGSTPGDFSKGTTQEASIAYNKIDLGAAVANVNLSYDRANVADLTHESTLLGGNVAVGPFRFNAGLAHYTAEQGVSNALGKRTDNSWTTSMSYLLNKTEFALGYQEMKGRNAGYNAGGVTLNPFGNTSGVTRTADGNKKSLYGSVMYHADKQTDFYVAADHFSVGGNWVVGDAQGNGMHFGTAQPFNSETELAVGMRFKF